MIALGLDLETSGLSIGSSKIVEVACALYDTQSKSIFEMWSSWVYDSRWPPMFKTDEAFVINGLDPEVLKRYAMTPGQAFLRVNEYLKRCHTVLGHNGNNFDKPFLNFEMEAYGLQMYDRTWIDTRYDLPFPANFGSKRLTHLALDHGYVVDPDEAHGALYDVINMLRVAGHYDLELALSRAKSPMIKITANPPMDKNPEVKAARFRWDPEKRQWWKVIREIDLQTERNNATFKIEKEEKWDGKN